MDRGETHLRLVAEAELRRVREQDASVSAGGRVMRVAQALTAVGAIDTATADVIQADFELALTRRQRKPPGGQPADSPWVPTGWRRMPGRSGQPPASQPAAGSSVNTGPSGVA